MRVLELSTETMKEKFVITPCQLKEAFDVLKSELMVDRTSDFDSDEFKSFREKIELLKTGESVTIGGWNFLCKEMDEPFSDLHIFVVNDTDYIWATSSEEAENHFNEEAGGDYTAETVELLPDDKVIYIFTDSDGERKWWTEPNEGATDIEQTTVKEFFSKYAGLEYPVTVHSTEW